jgi:LacI family transcriptional regulator
MPGTKKPAARRRRVLLAMYWWEDRVMEGVARYAAERGWALDCEMRWTHKLPDLRHWDGDGIIANPGVTAPLRPLVRFMERAGVPSVSLQPLGRAGGDARVVISHEEVGRCAARHLLDLGFRSLGYVLFDENPIERRRSDAFARCVREAGGRFAELPFRALARRLPRLPAPMGLMAANDINAVAVIHACLHAGRRVPEELAVVGVDDTEILCRFNPVPLSSVNCNYEQLGLTAAAVLDRLMDGRAAPRAPVVIPVKGVTARRSTDTLPVRDLRVATALGFLRAHFRTAIRVGDAAAHAGMPLRGLQARFRGQTGRTLSGELMRLRLAHARLLLGTTNAKTEAVAGECGFASRFHFARAFQRATGETPRAWRTKTRQAGGPEPDRQP